MTVAGSKGLVGYSGGVGAKKGQFGLVLLDANVLHSALQLLNRTEGETNGVVDPAAL